MNNEEIIARFESIERRLSDLEGDKEFLQAPMSRNSDSLFHVEGSQLTVLQANGNKTEEKTQSIALLTLLGYKQKFKQDKVLSTEVRRNVATHRIGVENFATYINNIIPKCILRIGKPQAKNSSYKLTPFGEAKAKEIIEQITKNES